MGTAWSDVITAAMVEIDDVRLQEQLAASPAQFYRRMAALVDLALPLMSRPPELISYLRSGTQRPAWADNEWVSTDKSISSETEAITGQPGYEICSVVRVIADESGAVTYEAYPAATYDPEKGTVTFPKQDRAGISYIVDFYTDGSFPELSDMQKRLMALAIAVVWDERFSRNWLNMQAKIHDESFTTVNEANYTDKITKRLHDNRIAFNDELRAYEQTCAFNRVMRKPGTERYLV